MQFTNILRIFTILTIFLMPFFSANAEHRLEGKVAIITGAGKGIGVGIAELFAKEGAKIVISSRTESDLKKVANEITKYGGDVIYVVADITKPQDMKKLADEALKKYGRIDILVHNAAGIYPPARIDVMTNEEWHEAIHTNLDAVFYAVKAVVPTMEKQKYGRIVFTSSISGPRVGLPTKSHYTASKAGMNGFMKTIAIELAKYNITVNAVEPGNIITDGLSTNGSKIMEERARAVPMRRLGTVDEVAYAHLFLASDEARYITGQSIIVDGGQTLPETHFSEF
jgi:3-oxoacyl-[acyl-carrier protein] reductase